MLHIICMLENDIIRIIYKERRCHTLSIQVSSDYFVSSLLFWCHWFCLFPGQDILSIAVFYVWLDACHTAPYYWSKESSSHISSICFVLGQVDGPVDRTVHVPSGYTQVSRPSVQFKERPL